MKKREKSVTPKHSRLISLNRRMAVVHAVQGLIVLAASSNFSLPVITRYLTFNDATQTLEEAQQTLWDVQLALLVALFFFISAAAHAFIGWIRPRQYAQELRKGMNSARWYEYSASASVMMVAIALLAGVYDFSSLIMIFMLTAIMNLMGLMMEVHNQTTKKTDWLSYNIGVIAGIVPWVVVGVYFMGSELAGSGGIPTFVYWIYGSLFLFFNSFAVNMILQYQKRGKWADYLYGEKTYIWLSLIAKSLLAWQVFAGALQPA